MRLGWLVAAVVASASVGCFKTPEFMCTTDSECTESGIQGTCEPVGYCSFPDASCSSGQRYSNYSGTYTNTCIGAESCSGQGMCPAGQTCNLTTQSCEATWWNTQWSRRSLIEIDNANITQDVTAFPILVTLTTSDFDYSAASAGGADLRFVASDGTTELAHEVDVFATGATSQVWVSVPQIAASGNPHTQLWMYYGNASAASSADPHTLWASNVSVHHLTDFTDATGNGHDGTATSSPSTVAGLIGQAQSFNGIGDAISLPTPADYDLSSSMTASVWIHSPPFTVAYECIVCKADTAWRMQRANLTRAAEYGTLRIAGGNDNLDGTATLDDSTWHYIAIVMNVGMKSLYVDGAVQATSNAGPTATNAFAVVIGANNGARFFGGLVDELRISQTARSADWIGLEFRVVAMPSVVTVHAVEMQ